MLLHPPPSSTPAANQARGVQFVCLSEQVLLQVVLYQRFSRNALLLHGEQLREFAWIVSGLHRVRAATPRHKQVQPLMKRINQEGAAAAPQLPSASRLPDTADAAAQTRRASERASGAASLAALCHQSAVGCLFKKCHCDMCVQNKAKQTVPLRVFLILLCCEPRPLSGARQALPRK